MKKLKESLFSKNTSVFLFNVTLILVIVYLLAQTNVLWANLIDKIIRIITPFIVGSIIAYLLAPMVRLFTKKMRRSLAIMLTILIVLIVIILIMLFIMPQIYRIGLQFYNDFSNGSDYGISEFFLRTFNFDVKPILDYGLTTFDSMLKDFSEFAMLNIPVIINKVISITVILIFGLAVSLYFLTDRGTIKNGANNFIVKIDENMPIYIKAIDRELRLYLRGMVFVMIERFLEYCLIYYIFRSPYWLVLGFLHGVGIFIPYLGGLFASALAVLSLIAVHSNDWVLLSGMFIFLVVIQYVDEYYIAPKILSKSTKVNPLWTIFALFAGGTLYGFIGILVAVPLFMCITVCIKSYIKIKNDKKMIENDPNINN